MPDLTERGQPADDQTDEGPTTEKVGRLVFRVVDLPDDHIEVLRRELEKLEADGSAEATDTEASRDDR